jgi:hypothetical protein
MRAPAAPRAGACRPAGVAPAGACVASPARAPARPPPPHRRSRSSSQRGGVTRRHAAPPSGAGGAGGSDADAGASSSAAAPEAAGTSGDAASSDGAGGYASSLSDLWRNDFFFMDARGRQDTERAFNGIAFSHELLVAAFGRGERPALQQELTCLQAELDAAKQQARCVRVGRVRGGVRAAWEAWGKRSGASCGVGPRRRRVSRDAFVRSHARTLPPCRAARRAQRRHATRARAAAGSAQRQRCSHRARLSSLASASAVRSLLPRSHAR